MGIFISSKMSGFRKWSEAHQAKTSDEARENGIIAAAEAERSGAALVQPLHRPWLVPGVGKL